MADWFVGQVMDKLIDSCFDYLQDQFRRQTGMMEELERLRMNLPMIQAVVSAYTQGKITDRNLKSWLWQLRDAIDEANDVLDDFEYMKLEKQAELNMEKTKVRSSFDRFFLEPARKLRKVCERGLKIDPNLERLEEAVQKLDRVSTQVSTFLHLVEKKENEQQVKDQQLCDDRASGFVPGPIFIGRDQEKEILMQWLRKPSIHNLSLLSIVGHGGMGKTTLLQNIFADELTKEFDLKIWVCVSNDFNVEEVIADMLKYLHKWSSHLTKLPPLQERLNSVTQSKKFLLVLDDIWEENTTKWEKIISPMANGNLGSKILVSTRINAATSMIPDMIIKNKETLRLNGLEEAWCLELLKVHAFAGMESVSEHKKLICIAEEMVKKLSGSPLATKVIGGVLKYDLTPEHWERVLNSNIGRVEVVPGLNTNPIMPILRFSFAYLPQSLQICFAFCGIFPQDHEFDKDDLVRMWIALGFIRESSIEGEILEDIGGRYFDVLVRKSFFDEFPNYGRIYYKMHDLLQDLAQSISSEECFRFVGDNVLSFKISKTIRHLFVETENLEVLRKIKEAEKLHSLFLFSERSGQDFTEILAEIFKASRSIRLLFIRSPQQEKMTETIENLRHLRYLNLTGDFTQMPRSLSSLYHSQFIIYKNTSVKTCVDDFLPGNVTNLSNLRHLILPEIVFSSAPEIGKLRSLQELGGFNVKNENGYRIGELEHLNELRKLRIHFLENVKDTREALTAKLFEKRKLTDLSLNWGHTLYGWEMESGRNIVNSDLDVNVLENLKPYKNLKSLSIFSHKGVSCSQWMFNADLISNLENISLNGCSEWETLPPFGQLPHLKSLCLYNMPKVKQLDKAGAAADDCFFPCLTELFLFNCPNLQEFPYLPPKLKKMEVQNIGWKACKQGSTNCCGNSKSIPLESLEVISCPNIEFLQADVRLESLRELRIEGCPKLISLGGLQQVESDTEKFKLVLSNIVIDEPSLLPRASISSMEELTIRNNDELVSFTIETEQWFPHVSSSLRELTFKSLKSLQSLPSSLERLSSLKILRVEEVPQLQQLLHIPASLKKLYLQYLKSLQSLASSWLTISSLNRLELHSIPLLKSLPELPPSLNKICLIFLESLQCLPSSLSAISSLKQLKLYSIPLLKSLPGLPSSLNSLSLESLYNLECLPSSFSAISSLERLYLESIPLKSLPDLPSSLKSLSVESLYNLECLPSSLSAISSLERLYLESIPLLKSLPDLPSSLKSLSLKSLDNLECLPSSLSAISSLNLLSLKSIPYLKSLPDLPSTLNTLTIISLDKLERLPSSLSAISSLKDLYLKSIPLLESLPELPLTLNSLYIISLDKLECLPSSLSAISSLKDLYLDNIPLLKSLPGLPSSLCSIKVRKCHPELMKHY